MKATKILEETYQHKPIFDMSHGSKHLINFSCRGFFNHILCQQAD